MDPFGDPGAKTRRAQLPLRWRLSALPARLASVGLLGLTAAVLLGRPVLLMIATPSLVTVAVVLRRGARPQQLEVSLTLVSQRCFEDDRVPLRVQVRSAEVLGEIAVSLELVPALRCVGSPQRRWFAARGADCVLSIQPRRWGRHEVGPLRVSVRSFGLGWTASAELRLDGLVVLPAGLPARTLAVPPRLRARLGAHVGRRPGSGVEFLGTRDYVPGDAARRVNAAMSSRLRSLVVNEYAGEHSADVVAFVDTTSDVRSTATASLDDAVRGAAGIAEAYLGAGDRVGVVAFGARVRWLAPDLGKRQYYRIMADILASRVDVGFVPPEISRLPRPALPPGCLIFVLSPLLDPRVIDSIGELLARGHPLVVVDVLTGEPFAGDSAVDQLALRIWRLDRQATLHSLREMGAVVVGWDPQGGMVEKVRLQPVLGGVR